MGSHYSLPDTLPPIISDAEAFVKAIDALLRRRPELSDVIAPFAALFTTSHAADEELSAWSPELPGIDPNKLAQGVPWLAGEDLSWLSQRAGGVARLVLEEIGRQFPGGSAECDRVLSAIEGGKLDVALLTRRLLDNDGEGVADLAKMIDVRPGLLVLAAREIAAPLLRRAARLKAGELGAVHWARGCCPACGSLPSAAFLARRNELNAEYLAGGGGQRVLLCSRCEHRWSTKRVMCPVCETEDPHTLEYEKVTDGRGERVYYCKSCRSYLPCLDLRESAEVEALEIEPLGLVHLDILARGKGFAPSASTPWNALGDGE